MGTESLACKTRNDCMQNHGRGRGRGSGSAGQGRAGQGRELVQFPKNQYRGGDFLKKGSWTVYKRKVKKDWEERWGWCFWGREEGGVDTPMHTMNEQLYFIAVVVLTYLLLHIFINSEIFLLISYFFLSWNFETVFNFIKGV